MAAESKEYVILTEFTIISSLGGNLQKATKMSAIQTLEVFI